MKEALKYELLQGYYSMYQGAYEGGASAVLCGAKAFSHLPLPNYHGMESKRLKDDKTALSYAYGLSLSGKRVITFIQEIPFDLISELGYTGVNGALVIVYLEDNAYVEYDSRPFFKACNFPIFEPSDSAELKRFVKISCNFSEKYDVPVVIRASRRLLNSFSDVPCYPRKDIVDRPYKKDASKYVLLPSTIKLCAEDIVERNKRLSTDAEVFPINVIFEGEKKIGVIASGEVARFVKESMPKASILSLGISNPLPIEKIKNFAESVGELYVIEEHSFIETALLRLGIVCKGAELFPREGRRTVADIAMWILGESNLTGENKYGVRTPDFCHDCKMVNIALHLKKLALPVFTDTDCGILSACFISGVDVGISSPLASAIAFGQTKKNICLLLEKEFYEQVLSLVDIDYTLVSVVVVAYSDNYKKYIPILNCEYEEIALDDFLKLENLNSKVYFVRTENDLCKYEI